MTTPDRDYGRFVYAAGAVMLGIIGLAFADFALQWQPVPTGVPARTVLACVSAALMLAAGAGLLFGRARSAAAAALGLLFGTWVLLHLPEVAAHPANVAAWLGVCETLALAMGGLVLCTGRWTRAARIVFGLCALGFGLSHFVYAKFTASMVPAWLPPSGLFWAYASGAAHVAGGLALISGVLARVAAWALAAMFAGFALLVHIPAVMAHADSQLNWVALGVTLAMTGAAWALGDRLPASGSGAAQ